MTTSYDLSYAKTVIVVEIHLVASENWSNGVELGFNIRIDVNFTSIWTAGDWNRRWTPTPLISEMYPFIIHGCFVKHPMRGGTSCS